MRPHVLTRCTLALLACSPALAGAQAAPAAAARPPVGAQTVTVKHAEGVTVVPRGPRRVVYLDAFALQLAFALKVPGAVGYAFDPQDSRSGVKIVNKHLVLPDGPTFFRHGDTAGLTWVGTDVSPSLEAIAALKPDLIVRSWWSGIQDYRQLSAIAPTISLDEGRNGAWQAALRTFAPIYGKSAAAEQVIGDVARQQARLAQDLKAAGVLRRTPNALVLSPGEAGTSNYYLYYTARVVPTMRQLGFHLIYPGAGPQVTAAKYAGGELGSYVSGEVLAGVPQNTLITYLQYLKTPRGPLLSASRAQVLDYVVEPDGPWTGPYADRRYLSFLRAQLLK